MKSTMSLFHKILVMVEDRDVVTLDELDELGSRRSVLGALGRLEGLGYIKRKHEKNQTILKLTAAGDELLADKLSWLAELDAEWDGKWRIVLVDVPENRRSLRQTFRHKLFELGFRMLQSSVWLSPSKLALEKLEEYIKKEKATRFFTILAGEELGNNQIDVAKLWQTKQLEKAYKGLFDTLSTQLPRLKKSPQSSFEAKCLVVELAQLAKQDPFTLSLLPKGWIGAQAKKWHEKLRPYCATAN